MPGRALTSAVAQVQRLKRSGMVDQVRPTLRGMLRNIPSGTERYSRSNPWSVKLSVWLFSVTVRTTCSGAPSGIRVLKSGCKVEELQHHSAERLQRAIAIKMVVAWRIQLMVRLGRELPDLPGELLFSDAELRVLTVFAKSRQRPPPARLGDAVELVARLGGWLGHTRDPPGAQLMWYGYIQLVAMTFAFELRDEYG